MSVRCQKLISQLSRLRRYTKHIACRGRVLSAVLTTMGGMNPMNSVYASSTDYDPQEDVNGGATGVLEPEEQLHATEPGDHERFKHFVQKDKLTEAIINGTPVVALCGKVWVPSRDPERFPMCPSCQEIWDGLES